MKLKSLQEIFDEAVPPVLHQGQRCTLRSGLCVYHDPETGNRCVIGQLLPPEVQQKYQIEENGGILENSRLQAALVDAGYLAHALTDVELSDSECYDSRDEEHYRLMGRLQDVHDDPNLFHNWAGYFAKVANEFGLSTEAIKPWLTGS